jgi:chemotaxis protein histidine kinase CheA
MIKVQNIRNRVSSKSNFINIPQALLSLFVVAVLLLVIGCSGAADEQATADHMRLEAAERNEASTEEAERNEASTQEAEILAVTAQAIDVAMAAIDATTREAEEEAIMQATADSEATKVALAAANEQATADAQATVAAEATAYVEATVIAQATADAIAFATASYEATREAFKTEQLSMIREAQDETPVVDLEEGELVHDDDEEPETQATDVDLRNFVVQTQFAYEPGETSLDTGDFGLEFRTGDENITCLLLNQDGGWQLINGEEGDEEVIQEGQTDALQDGWNEVALYIDEDGGFFSLNGEYIEELDLEQSAEKGDIILVTGMGEDTEANGASVQFKQLQVWSMDPIPPTPTPAPISSAPQQPASGSGSTFPETPIKPFDRDEFVSFVGQLRDSLRSYTSEMNLMKTTHKSGDCGTFNGWMGLWILRSPGYTGVPPSFSSLYRDYRSLLGQVVNLSQEIRTICNAGGGFVSDETIDALNEFLSWAYPQSEQMVSEASVLPAP